MTEIPEDVMEAARSVVERIATQHVFKDDCVADVARAILAERERCAKIVDAEREIRERLFAENGSSINVYQAGQAVRLAEAIRKGG